MVQLLLGHTKIESTVRYLGFDIDHALAKSEQVEISMAKGQSVCSALQTSESRRAQVSFRDAFGSEADIGF